MSHKYAYEDWNHKSPTRDNGTEDKFRRENAGNIGDQSCNAFGIEATRNAGRSLASRPCVLVR